MPGASRRTGRRPDEPTFTWPLLRIWPILLFTVLQQGAVFGTRPLIALYATDLGGTAAVVGVMASLFGLGAVIVSIPVGRLIDARGPQFVGRAGCALLAVGLFVTAGQRRSAAADARTDGGDLLGLVQFGQDALMTFFPLYTRGLGFSATAIGLILSVRSLSQLLIRPFLSAMVDRFGRGRVLLTSLMSGGVFSVAMGVLASMPSLLVAGLLAGVAIGLAQPLTMAAVAEITPAHWRGMAFSLRMVGNRLGQMVSPLVLGIVAGPLGPAVAIWLSGGLLTLGAAALSGTLGRALGETE